MRAAPASGELLEPHSICSCWRRAAAHPPSEPASRTSSKELVATVGVGPPISAGAIALPMWTASATVADVPRPTMRLTQPLRSAEPGSASSTSSIASKCDRLGTGRPTAWTAAISPDCHSQPSGASFGWSPNIGPACSSDVVGTRSRGLAAAYCGSPCGTTSPRPSRPPRKLSTTSTLPPVVAAKLAWRTASPNTEVATPVAPAAAIPASSRRRESWVAASSAQQLPGPGCGAGWVA